MKILANQSKIMIEIIIVQQNYNLIIECMYYIELIKKIKMQLLQFKNIVELI